MATSGTYNFTLDINEVMEEAFDMVGGQQVLGADPAKARRSLNMLFQDLGNRGINLWTLEQAITTCTDGTGEYAFTSATNDILSAVVRTSSASGAQDIELQAMGYQEYLAIPNKSQEGRPTQIFVRRDRDNPSFILWPVPDDSYQIVYWRIRSMQDAGKATDNPDVPKRFLPALVFGLAYWLGLKRQFTDAKMMAAWQAKLGEIYSQFETLLTAAQGEDRSRTDMKVVPRLR